MQLSLMIRPPHFRIPLSLFFVFHSQSAVSSSCSLNRRIMKMYFAALCALLIACIPTASAGALKTAATVEIIALSPDVAVGLVLGLFFLGMLVFALTMVMDIGTNDKLGQPREGAPVKTA